LHRVSPCVVEALGFRKLEFSVMASKTNSVAPVFNILSPLPTLGAGEAVDTLVKANGLRLERIVSHGQASPPGFWYDQNEAEWVLLITGRARLTIAGEAQDRELYAGDSLFLPAHCRHRVAWTDPDQPTVWLSVFVDERLSPTPLV
jgi:cupin 2 domain-containing protein